MKIQIEDKAAGSWRTSVPICSLQRLDHMWRPPQVPPWLGGCQLGFYAALDGDNEKLQTSLPLITGRVCWDCSASPLQDVMIRQSALSQLNTGRLLRGLSLKKQPFFIAISNFGYLKYIFSPLCLNIWCFLHLTVDSVVQYILTWGFCWKTRMNKQQSSHFV